MSNQSPSSFPPSGPVPGAGGNRTYVVLAVLFFLVTGGLLAWKFLGSSNDTASKTLTPAPSTSRPVLADAPPPPPPDEPATTASAAPTAKAAAGPMACGVCTGKAPDALQSDIRARARLAQNCYERALRQNSSLKGKVSLSIKVDQSGNVCAANVGSDSVGSPEVNNCVTNLFRNQHLATPATGGCAEITIPLNFQPKTP